MIYKRPDWDEYFLNIARVVASRSTCLRAQVGSVVVDSRKKIKSTGYNGMPHKVVNCLELGECFRIKNKIESGTRYETCRAIHSEQNAIIQAGEENCSGSSLYIYGHKMVCALCKRFIIQSGIIRVVLRHDADTPLIIINPEDWIREL